MRYLKPSLFVLLLCVAVICSEFAAAEKAGGGKPEAGDKESKVEGKAGKAKKKESKKEEPKKDEAKKDEPSKPETLELKAEPLKLFVKLDGLFESKQTETVALKAESFSAFELKEVVAHGTKVRKSDTLIKFNPKKYDEALTDQKLAIETSAADLKESEVILKYLEKKRPILKNMMERSKKEDDEDLAYFYNVEKDQLQKGMEFQKKSGQMSVDSQKEELRQLEKMYKEDDLIEDTEEFILKRTKFQYEAALFQNEIRQESIKRMQQVFFPRTLTNLQELTKLEVLDYQKEVETFDFAFEMEKLKLAAAKSKHDKLVESFKKFEQDKKFLTLTSPADGMVYYGEYNGKLSKGKWTGAATLAGSLEIDEMVKNGQVLFTIVNSVPTFIRATVAEKDLHWISAGTQGVAIPTAFPNARYKVRTVNRNEIPSPANDYTALLAVSLPNNVKIYPGMGASVNLTVYEKKEAILVPTAALKREEYEEDSFENAYLFVFDGKQAVKRKVKTGQVKGDKTEIISGVKTGEQVYSKYENGEKK